MQLSSRKYWFLPSQRPVHTATRGLCLPGGALLPSQGYFRPNNGNVGWLRVISQFFVSDALLNKLVKGLWQELPSVICAVFDLSTVCVLYDDRGGCRAVSAWRMGPGVVIIHLACLIPASSKTG